MVHYPNPKYIRKSHLRNARPYAWTETAKGPDQNATVATCLRCAQSISKQKKRCEKPLLVRCRYCGKNNRGGCTLVPREFNGKVTELYRLRRLYDRAVRSAATPRTNAQVISAGVKLARAQRLFNLELATFRRVAAHTGTPIGVPTQVPTSTPQFLSLILVEQRRIATALEGILAHASRLNGEEDDDDESSSSSEEEDDDDSVLSAGGEDGDGNGGNGDGNVGDGEGNDGGGDGNGGGGDDGGDGMVGVE